MSISKTDNMESSSDKESLSQHPPKTQRPPFALFFRLLKAWLQPHQRYVIGALIALTSAAGSVLALGGVVRHLVDYGLSQINEYELHRTLLLFMATVSVLALSSAARFYYTASLGKRLLLKLRIDLFDKVLHSTTAQRPQWGSEIVQEMERDLNTIEQWVSSQLSVSLRNFLLCIGGIGLLFHSSVKLTLIFLTLIPALIAPILILTKRFRARVKAQKTESDTLSTYFDEHLRALPVIQSLNFESEAVRQLHLRSEHLQETQSASLKGRAWLIAAVMFAVFGGIAFILWLGGHDVLKGTLSKGTLSAFVLYAMMVAGALGALSDSSEELKRVAYAVARIQGWLSLESHHHASAVKTDLVPTQAASPIVQFNDVTFTYPNRTLPALRHISLDVYSGEHIAIVGASGAGKSTLFQLLLGFYLPDSGTLKTLNTPLTFENATELRRTISWVNQDPMLFIGTVRNNLLYGAPQASEKELQDVCEWANLSNWIDSLPQGLDTPVGNLNLGVSGGQKQRIAIARAMLANRPILLLDEATSALDSENERAIQEALNRLCQGRTVLTIAHRLSTVRASHRIIVMDQGMIIDIGTHAELMSRQPIYSRFVELQTFEVDA
ncbi:MAG: ATP-binding cassette domain-containing protein [Pseudomonadota bacterium]